MRTKIMNYLKMIYHYLKMKDGQKKRLLHLKRLKKRQLNLMKKYQ
jgi:hypothetical protein